MDPIPAIGGGGTKAQIRSPMTHFTVVGAAIGSNMGQKKLRAADTGLESRPKMQYAPSNKHRGNTSTWGEEAVLAFCIAVGGEGAFNFNISEDNVTKWFLQGSE